jgi:hypothetical protein
MSVLAVDPSAPFYVKAAADAVLCLHIGGGAVGMISGVAALLVKKGGRLHAIAGTTFFVAMLIMAGIGAGVSLIMREPTNVIAGVMTAYLVLTAWIAVKRRGGRIGRFEIGGLVAAIVVAAAGAVFIYKAAHSPTGTVGDSPPQAFYIFLLVGLIAAAGDLKTVLQRGISGAACIARHLWRMCTALAIAMGSFFFGQAQVLPPVIRHSPLPALMVLAPLLLLIFWSIRIRFKGRLAWRLPRFARGATQTRSASPIARTE